MYKGLAVVFSFYFLGEIIAEVGSLPVPGNVLGMTFLFLALVGGVIDLEDVEKESEFFVRNMSIMFVPPGVGVMVYFDLLKEEILPIVGALFIGFVITVGVTGKVVEVLR